MLKIMGLGSNFFLFMMPFSSPSTILKLLYILRVLPRFLSPRFQDYILLRVSSIVTISFGDDESAWSQTDFQYTVGG